MILMSYNTFLMIGKITKLAYKFGSHVKRIQAQAVSTQHGVKVTYPQQNNKTHDIQNPLETLIASIAACEVTTLRAIAKQKNVKLGKVTWNKIESGYDLAHWLKGSGKDNKINDVYLDAEIEANVSQSQLQKFKELTEKYCPIYQMVEGSGVKINSTWKLKKID